MNENITVYHGHKGPLKDHGFRPFSHFGPRCVADEFAVKAGTVLYEVELNIGDKPLEMTDILDHKDPRAWMSSIDFANALAYDFNQILGYDDNFYKERSPTFFLLAAELLLKNGYTSIIYTNSFEGTGQDVCYMNLRSQDVISSRTLCVTSQV